jgi:hypothetical protein
MDIERSESLSSPDGSSGFYRKKVYGTTFYQITYCNSTDYILNNMTNPLISQGSHHNSFNGMQSVFSFIKNY